MKVRHLLCLLFLPTLAFAQQQFYGTTASAVQLSPPSDDIEKIPLKSGQTITSDNVRASIEALYATGRYSYIEADALMGADGTQLTFKVTPHYFFSTFRLDQEDLLERAVSSSIRIPVGEKFSKTRVKTILEETTQLLEDAGYFQAVVTPDYIYEETNLVTIVLHAAVRPKAEIGTIKITGGEETFPQPGALADFFGLSAGDSFSADALTGGMSEIRRRFSDLGFLNTRVSAQREYDPVLNLVNLAITIEPGKFALVEARPPLIENRRLRELVPIYEEGAYDPDLVREGRARIVEFLQQEGYFEATVAEAEEVPAPLNDAIQIIFHVNPGEKHKIGSIRIQGNKFFSEEDLRTRMRLRTPGWLDRGAFSPALLARDIAMIETLYRRAGFEEVAVSQRQADSEDHTLDVTIDIVEGSRSNIERLVFSGNTGLTEQELRQSVRIKEGDIYAPAEAESARAALMGLYFSRGYPEVRVDAAADRNAVTGGKQITFQIEEGPRYHIGQLMVAGNTRTAPKVIRRESGLREFQDPYNPELLLEAQRKLYATGLFNRVEIVPIDHDTGEYRTMLIQVEDAKAILVSPGVGAKEYAGPRVTLDVSHNNLFGLARSLTLRTRWGLREREFQATYREPRLFNHELQGFGSVLIEKTDLRFFEARRLEFSIQVLKKLSPTRSFFTTASYQNVNLQDIKLNPALRRFPDLKGVIQIARLGASFLGDWRKGADGTIDAINPHHGSYNRNDFEVASRAWGSEVNFVSLFNQSMYFKPVPKGVLAFSSRVGWKKPFGQDDELPIFERYFAGGSTTLRGFDLDEAGPPGGGQLMTIGNVEYRVPLRLLPARFGGFGGALFYDTGTVFERPADFSLSDFTHSAGVGIRYQTPLGPVRFDVGFNLHPRTLVRGDGTMEKEENVQVFFTLGHTF